MTQLNFGRDVQGMNAYAPQFPDIRKSVSLASGDDDDITVPSTNTNWIAIFSYQPGATIWVSVNDTAEAPAGATFADTTSILLPAQLKVQSGDTISCYNNSSTDQDVGIVLYAVPVKFFTFGATFNIGNDSPFVCRFSLGESMYPPSATYLMTEDDKYLITEDGNKFITN